MTKVRSNVDITKDRFVIQTSQTFTITDPSAYKDDILIGKDWKDGKVKSNTNRIDDFFKSVEVSYEAFQDSILSDTLSY